LIRLSPDGLALRPAVSRTLIFAGTWPAERPGQSVALAV